MKKLLLIDGYSIMFRAYYATAYGPIMRTSKGIPTNAIFAFSNMLNKVFEQLSFDYILVAFDCGKKNFRHELFEMYKGTRKAAPEDLVLQFPLVRELLSAYGIPYLEIVNYEADDIIGSMSRKFKDLKIDILSSDRDLLQLINDDVNVLMMKTGQNELKRMDAETLMLEYALTPLQIIDFKGLSGDASDNIPGIEKVGEKSATKWLNEYQTLENVLANADKIGGKIGERIKASEEIAKLSKVLATIKLDINIDVKLEELAFKPNYLTLMQFYQKYEMKTLANRLKIEPTTNSKLEQKEVMIKELSIEECCYFYYEATYSDTLYFSNGENVMMKSRLDIINDEEFKEVFKKQCFVTYDLKAQSHLIKDFGLEFNKGCNDIRIMQALNDSSINTDFENLINLYSDQVQNFQHKSILALTQTQVMALFYQAVVLFKVIYEDLLAKLKADEMFDLYRDLELPLTFVLFDMEVQGVKINRDVLNEIKDKCESKIAVLQEAIYALAGEEFNINSPKQLAYILYDKLQLPSSKKQSTAQDVLEYLKTQHPIVAYVLEYRKYAKLLSTYALGLQKFIFDDGKIHTIYNQCLTTTGRLSSSEPNLQNISIRNEETKAIRKAFVPSCDEMVLLAADYSQVELRMLAHFAKCEPLIEAFKNNIDIHTSTASAIFNVSPDHVSEKMRRSAKAVNFGIVYGISDFGLATQVGVSKKEAQAFIDAYFEAYPHIKEYMDEIVEFCVQNQYVKTISHRRRYIREISNTNYMVRESAKRAAMNAPIQGSAADLIKIAMVNIYKTINEQGLKSKMILQVHDELIFEVLKSEVDVMSKIIEDGMENALNLTVPLIAEVKIGNNWLEAK